MVRRRGEPVGAKGRSAESRTPLRKFSTKEVVDTARSILQARPEGVRFTELKRAVLDRGPATPSNTIAASLVWWAANGGEVSKPSPGLWVLTTLLEEAEKQGAAKVAEATPARVLEVDLYQPFAEWLKEQGEVSDARALGGSSMQTKWGTPDVIGVTKPQPSDPVKFLHEIVAAEIKSEASSAIVAFGQACAYRLFAHRVYIVMPVSIALADRDRLQALCSLYGIGFALWDRDHSTRFSLQERARSRQPDLYYANEFARRLQSTDVKAFNALF